VEIVIENHGIMQTASWQQVYGVELLLGRE